MSKVQDKARKSLSFKGIAISTLIVGGVVLVGLHVYSLYQRPRLFCAGVGHDDRFLKIVLRNPSKRTWQAFLITIDGKIQVSHYWVADSKGIVRAFFPYDLPENETNTHRVVIDKHPVNMPTDLHSGNEAPDIGRPRKRLPPNSELIFDVPNHSIPGLRRVSVDLEEVFTPAGLFGVNRWMRPYLDRLWEANHGIKPVPSDGIYGIAICELPRAGSTRR